MTSVLGMIDHTILKPEATREMVEVLCKEAMEYKFAAVCVNPYHVKFCKEILKDSNVKVATATISPFFCHIIPFFLLILIYKYEFQII